MARAQTNGAVEQTSADLSAQIETLKSDVAALTDTIAEYGRAQKAQLGAVAEDKIETAKKLEWKPLSKPANRPAMPMPVLKKRSAPILRPPSVSPQVSASSSAF
jgi:hypothetical protein